MQQMWGDQCPKVQFYSWNHDWLRKRPLHKCNLCLKQGFWHHVELLLKEVSFILYEFGVVGLYVFYELLNEPYILQGCVF